MDPDIFLFRLSTFNIHLLRAAPSLRHFLWEYLRNKILYWGYHERDKFSYRKSLTELLYVIGTRVAHKQQPE